MNSSKRNLLLEVFGNILDSLHFDFTTDFDPDEFLHKVLNSIDGSVDKVFPRRKRSNKQLKKFRNPWITQGMLNSIKQCHYLQYSG